MSETQDRQAQTTSSADAPAPGNDPGQAPIKPVIPAKAAKRANASVIGMIIALLVSVLAFLPIVLMNPAPKSEGYRPNVNVSAIAANAADVAGFTPAAPDTHETFRPNYARWESGTGSGVPTWEVGYLTPKEAFIGLTQTRQANPTWILQKVSNAPATGTRSAGGQEWQLHDSGKGNRSLVLEYRGTTIILSGTASLDELSLLAGEVIESADRNAAAIVSQTGTPTP